MPHTHWDREWYEPFPVFRHRLVALLDELLPLLEADPSYARFLLDGQMAVIDDYLAVRPEAEGRLRALAATGRLSMGPWYVLPDEFLVSPETLVRDLELGLARGAAFGGSMEVGYLPDMFGHVAQMPQLLSLAGFTDAVVWRGVPRAVEATGFFWEAPDGSVVRAEYLPAGYSNGAALPSEAKALVARLEDLEAEQADFLLGPLLVMNGGDHRPPQRDLGRVVAEANSLQDRYRIELTSLSEYLAHVPREGLGTWRGELRSGARANVLMGVLSNRVDVKQAAARTAYHLERRAEPFAALFLPADRWPGRLLELAWLEVVRNAAHDSICACSVDDVVDAVVHRFAEARHVAEQVARDALAALGSSMATPGPIVVNPAPRPRSGLVELVLVAPSAPADTQLISARAPLPGEITLDAAAARTLLGMLQGPKIDADTYVQRIEVSEEGAILDVAVALGPGERPIDVAAAKQDLYARLGARPDLSVRVRLDQPPLCKVVAKVADVPGFGWRRFEPAPLVHPVSAEVEADGTVVLHNDLVTVAVDAVEGTFSIDGLAGFGRLVDGGDLGDAYNYSPPAHDEVVASPDEVAVTVEENGPVRAVAQVTARFSWPERAEASSGRRVGSATVEVTTRLELRADESTVRVEHRFTNPSADHRLRVHHPLVRPATSSLAECAFATVHRGLEAEGRPEERGLPTFPSRRFVQAGGLTICHEGLHEYELVDVRPDGSASTLALTLLRSTGMISRLGMANRPLPAGPLMSADGLQLLHRVIEARYALALGDVDPFELADDVLVPLETVEAPGGGRAQPVGSVLEVLGGQVTAVRRVAGVLEVRVCNPTARPEVVSFGTRSGWVVDLRGRPMRPFEGRLPLGPFAIATVRLTGG